MSLLTILAVLIFLPSPALAQKEPSPQKTTRQINRERRERIALYELQKTTEEDFWEDGWNGTDPLEGKIGIVRMDRKRLVNVYVLGFYRRSAEIGPVARNMARSGVEIVKVNASEHYEPPYVPALENVPLVMVARLVFAGETLNFVDWLENR